MNARRPYIHKFRKGESIAYQFDFLNRILPFYITRVDDDPKDHPLAFNKRYNFRVPANVINSLKSFNSLVAVLSVIVPSESWVGLVYTHCCSV